MTLLIGRGQIAVSNGVNIVANFNPQNPGIGTPGISGLANWPEFRDTIIISLLVPSEPRFSIDWYPYESLVMTGRASSQNCSSAPVDTSELFEKSEKSTTLNFYVLVINNF